MPPIKHLLWAAVPALLALLRLSEAFRMGSLQAAVTGLGFAFLAVAWAIRPPFTARTVPLPERWKTSFVVSQGVGLMLLVLGFLWRLAA
jgi:hypothetical protein